MTLSSLKKQLVSQRCIDTPKAKKILITLCRQSYEEQSVELSALYLLLFRLSCNKDLLFTCSYDLIYPLYKRLGEESGGVMVPFITRTEYIAIKTIPIKVSLERLLNDDSLVVFLLKPEEENSIYSVYDPSKLLHMFIRYVPAPLINKIKLGIDYLKANPILKYIYAYPSGVSLIMDGRVLRLLLDNTSRDYVDEKSMLSLFASLQEVNISLSWTDFPHKKDINCNINLLLCDSLYHKLLLTTDSGKLVYRIISKRFPKMPAGFFFKLVLDVPENTGAYLRYHSTASVINYGVIEVHTSSDLKDFITQYPNQAEQVMTRLSIIGVLKTFDNEFEVQKNLFKAVDIFFHGDVLVEFFRVKPGFAEATLKYLDATDRQSPCADLLKKYRLLSTQQLSILFAEGVRVPFLLSWLDKLLCLYSTEKKIVFQSIREYVVESFLAEEILQRYAVLEPDIAEKISLYFDENSIPLLDQLDLLATGMQVAEWRIQKQNENAQQYSIFSRLTFFNKNVAPIEQSGHKQKIQYSSYVLNYMENHNYALNKHLVKLKLPKPQLAEQELKQIGKAVDSYNGRAKQLVEQYKGHGCFGDIVKAIRKNPGFASTLYFTTDLAKCFADIDDVIVFINVADNATILQDMLAAPSTKPLMEMIMKDTKGRKKINADLLEAVSCGKSVMSVC